MEKFKSFCKANKALLLIALLLNITFLTIVILSVCGINIAKLVVENEALNTFNNWVMPVNTTILSYRILTWIGVFDPLQKLCWPVFGTKRF